MNNEMTMGKWLLTFLILCIPCVNIIMLFVWAFGNGDYPARKTFSQAYLILVAILIVLYIIIFAIFGASIAAMTQTMYGLFVL